MGSVSNNAQKHIWPVHYALVIYAVCIPFFTSHSTQDINS